MIFDGRAYSKNKEGILAAKVADLSAQGKNIVIRTLVFPQDAGSVLYTKLKSQAAGRIGISYLATNALLQDDPEELVRLVQSWGQDPTVTGVMIQKPSKGVFLYTTGKSAEEFSSWWQQLTAAIPPAKDVDCLTSHNLAILEGVLPATVKACLDILSVAKHSLQIEDSLWKTKKALVIGRSDIVGKPLATVLARELATVTNVGKQEFAAMVQDGTTADYDIVICAVGAPNLVTGQMLTEGCIVIDVGAPQADVQYDSVATKAAFLTPVPGGVGPVTVISLLENAVTMCESLASATTVQV